jgi:hypothetical protein
LDEKTRYEIDMLRAKIIARGDFQRVGFRDVVQKIARNMGLTGTVQNLEPYDVRKLQLEYTQIAHKILPLTFSPTISSAASSWSAPEGPIPGRLARARRW